MELDAKRLKDAVDALVASGTTKSQIAKKAGMSLQQFSNILNGNQKTENMKLGTVEKLAKAVGVSGKDLIR